MQHRFLFPVALSLALAPFVPAIATPSPLPLLPGSGGTVFVAGGHIDDQDADLWGAYAAYAKAAHHEARPKVAVFCSARDSLAQAEKAFREDAPGAWSYARVFRHYGLEPVFVPIAIDNYRTAAQDPANAALLKGASAVWFGGGAQNLHARCLLNDDGSDTPLMAAVRRVYRDGGIVGGTSAGAAIMDRFTYGDGESYDYLAANQLVFRGLSGVTSADSPFGEGKLGGYTHGFGFLKDAAVDTHVDARGRYGRVLVAMRTLKNPFGLALAENTALAVRGHRGMAYGATHVFIADGRRATYGKEGPYGATGLAVSLLAPHDAFDFDTGRVTSSSPVLPPVEATQATPEDMLAGAALPQAMITAATSGVAELHGATHMQESPGFDFTLRKGPATRAYGDVAHAHVSVQHLELNVSPRADALKARAAGYFDAYVADLEKLTNIDSGTGDVAGSKAIADWLDTRLTALGGATERVTTPRGTHLIARFKGTGTKRILLLAHTDTVFVKGDAAKRPFRMDARKHAFGPGVGDDKATSLQLVYAMQLLHDVGFKRYGEVVLYFDAEEETGSDEGDAIITRLAKQANVCLVMDTARPNWGMVAKRKGYAKYVIEVTGRSGHAGNAAHHAASATMELGHLITALYQLASPLPANPDMFAPETLAKKGVADHGQYIPPNTINLAVVSTPNTKFNVIPDSATAKVEVRCFDAAELQRLDKAIRALAAKPVVPGTQVKVEGHILAGPEEKTPKVQTLIDLYKAIARREYGAKVVEWQAGGVSDGNVAAPYVPTVDALGIEEYDEHTEREWVDLNTVVPRTVVLVKYLEALSEQ